MKKLLTVLTVLLILLSSGCAKQETSVEEIPQGTNKYPTVYDDTILFKDEDEFYKELEVFKTWAQEFDQYRGKLDTPDGLYGYVSTMYDVERTKQYDRLNAYINFGKSAFPLNEKYERLGNLLYDAVDGFFNSKAYFDGEFSAIPYEKRIELFSDDRLIEYQETFYPYLVEDLTALDEQFLEAYNNATISLGRQKHIFDTLANFEMPKVEYKLKNGETIFVDSGNYDSILASTIIDYEDKVKIFDAWWKNVSQYKNTLTLLLETQLLEQYADAKTFGYDSTKYMALSNVGFNEDIIQILIDNVKKYTNEHAKYYSLFGDKDGKYYTFSKTVSLADGDYKLSYDDGVDEVLDALSIFGDEYINNLKGMFNSGHVDVYPNEFKSSGAFEMGDFVGQYPFVLLNYRGTIADVADIAHEMGHACYDILCNQNQQIYDWGSATFTHEVASITNELIYYQYRVNNAKSDDEKICALEQMLARFSTDLFNTTMWQEMEIYCHEIVENGGTLNSDDLCNKWTELSKEYYGDNYVQGDYGQYRWLTLQCLYNNYYEYTYATAICYATVLSQQIINNVPGAKDNYLEFLKLGGSVPSIYALSVAGIDVYDDTIYAKTVEYFGELVEELANLIKK